MNELIFFHPRWIFVISEWQEVDYILRFLCFGARRLNRKIWNSSDGSCSLVVVVVCYVSTFFVLFFLFGFVMFWFCFCFYERLIFVNGNILTNYRVKKVSLVWFAFFKFIPRHSCILDSDPSSKPCFASHHNKEALPLQSDHPVNNP